MGGIEAIATFDTIYNADTVEWCPVSPYLNLLVCGTYQLNEETKDRFGRLYLLRITDSLRIVQQIEMAAIPDCKWCPATVNSNILLAVATTAAQVIVYNLKSGNWDDSVQLSLLCEINLKRENDTTELLTLSLSWYTDNYDTLLSASDSSGCVTVLQLTNNVLSVKHNWKAHSYEAWTTAFNAFNPSIIYTGNKYIHVLCIWLLSFPYLTEGKQVFESFLKPVMELFIHQPWHDLLRLKTFIVKLLQK